MRNRLSAKIFFSVVQAVVAALVLVALGGVTLGGVNLGGVASALAAEPAPWGLGFQEPASPYAERVNDFHNLLLIIIGVISLFVTLLLLFVMVRFNERANPVPSRTTHNTRLEVIWTVGPILVLILIAIFSFPLLYFGDVIPDSKYTVKVTGHQWYWSYEYETPEGEVFSFDSLLLTDEEAVAQGLPRLLAVDEPNGTAPLAHPCALLSPPPMFFTLLLSPPLPSRLTQYQADSTKLGQKSCALAPTTDNALNFAAQDTPICQL